MISELDKNNADLLYNDIIIKTDYIRDTLTGNVCQEVNDNICEPIDDYCCDLFSWKPPIISQLKIDELCDDNDNDILFIHNNDPFDETFPKIPLRFICESFKLNSYITMVRKISYDKKIGIILVYKYDNNNSRALINGDIYKDNNHFKIIEFNYFDNLQLNNINYEYISKCVWN